MSASRENFSEGSSSTSLWVAVEILSSSPFAFGSMAKEMAGSANSKEPKTNGRSFPERESPVSVSFSFATPPMSPAGTSGTFCCCLPSGEKRGPKRSETSRVVFA